MTVQTIKIQKPVAFVGGVAKNAGFRHSLETYLQQEILVPENPEMISAYGAALLGMEAD